ncbi:hypothetical protein VTJ83DRAFT_7080 [Remersonia thermophila]|uniref:NACHT domain-containing protein n=1 Tax=Remersonia thermophila TaxID=72144 RepID=A0ABR4D3F9_9PEZI
MLCLQAISSERQSAILRYTEKLWEVGQHLVHDHRDKVHQIEDAVKSLDREATQYLDGSGNGESLISRISRALETLGSSCSRDYIAEHEVVKSLYFECLAYRHDSIPDAHQNTYHWALFGPSPEGEGAEHPGCTIREWLRTGDGIYWVSGKPGSGKSTFMKFVADHCLTQELLAKWAGDKDCVVASYYFWSAGTDLQKTTEGLLRTLLFDIFVRCPSLIQVTVPDRWEQHSKKKLFGLPTWRIPELLSALERPASHDIASHKVCLFIDGLDEYHGGHDDHLRVVRMLKRLSLGGNFKICVSSRPWNVFEDELGQDPTRKLYMHELTRQDIKRYVTSTLEASRHWRTGTDIDAPYRRVMANITDRAEGVFLWVVLVVRSVLEGLSNRDPIEMLEQRVRDIPTDLDVFFQRIIESVDPRYRKHMAVYFLVLLDSPGTLTLIHFWFLDRFFNLNVDTALGPVSITHVLRPGRQFTMSRQLNARCMGLIEASPAALPNGPQDEYTTVTLLNLGTVTFLHRTVRDFLQTEKVASLLTNIADSYPTNTAMLLACSSLEKSMYGYSNDPMMAVHVEIGRRDIIHRDVMHSWIENRAMQQLVEFIGHIKHQVLTYASRVDALSPGIVARCVDELRREPDDSTFAYMLVKYGLCEYVRKSVLCGSKGFIDRTILLQFALDAAANDKPQVAMLPMVKTLLDVGAPVTDDVWFSFCTKANRARGRLTKEDMDNYLKEQQQLLDVVLPVVEDINATAHSTHRESAEVAWADLFIFCVEGDHIHHANQERTGPAVNLISTLFEYGADPNAPCRGTTAWLRFSGVVRNRAAGRNSDWMDAMSLVTEALVNKGADLSKESSLKPDEVADIFPPRAARRILEAMARRQKQTQESHMKPSEQVNQKGSWKLWNLPAPRWFPLWQWLRPWQQY